MWGMLTVYTTDMFLRCILKIYLYVFDFENNIIIYHIVSQSPAIMHMLDKSGSCGKFDNYQRPEGFPVGTCVDLLQIVNRCCSCCSTFFFFVIP